MLFKHNKNLSRMTTQTVSIAEQIESLKSGNILSSNGSLNESGCWNFYDWFCKDSSLQNKAKRLMPMVQKLVTALGVDPKTHYVFFKNNCPVNGPLYDDLRICNIQSGHVIWNFTPKSGHSGMAELWGRENDFKDAIATGKNMTELLKNIQK